MTTKKTFKMTFSFDVSINNGDYPNGNPTNEEILEEINAIKDYIFTEVRNLEGQSCYSVKINTIQGE